MWVADTFRGADGQALSLVRSETIDSSKPHLHFAHATGFNANTYRRFLEPLQAHANLWAWDMRAHGLSQTTDSRIDNWQLYYRDMEALVDHVGEPMVLAGHSVGGVCAAAAAVNRPQHVKALALIDPVFIMDKEVWWMRLGALLGMTDRHYMAQAAARRSAAFPSVDVALRAYRGRGVFKTFPTEWISDYLETGLIETSDGYRLACDRHFESSSYASTERYAKRLLQKISCPMSVIAAEHGSTISHQSEAIFKRVQPNAQFSRLAGTSHMVPMEAPERVREMIIETLAKAG